jgi:hypothetical protein
MSSLGFRGVLRLRINGVDNELPVVSFEHVESIYDGVRWKIRLEHPQWNFFAPLVEGESPELPLFEYKFSFTGASSTGPQGNESVWYQGVLLKAESDNTVHGAQIKLIGGDVSLRMKSRTRTQFWSVPFDQMVTAIAGEHGLAARVEVADETTKQQPVTYWQYGENDWDFIKRIANKQRSLVTLRGDYLTWVQDGLLLHCRPPGMEGPAIKSWGTGALGVGLKGIRLLQRKRALQMGGGFSVQGLGYDPLTKLPITFVKNYTNFPENTRLAPKVNTPALSEIPAMTFRSTDENLVELSNTATTVIGQNFRHMYMAEVDIFPDFQGYFVGDVVTLNLAQTDGRPDQVYTGNYLLEQRRTKIVKGKMEMQLLMSRIGSFKGTAPLVGRQMDTPAVVQPAGQTRGVTPI